MKQTYALLARKTQNLQHNRFSGKRVRQNSAKLEGMKKRDRRLRKRGLSVLLFAS